MNIISHRGYWKTANEKNLKVAFKRSFDLNFGTETDFRDCAGKIVISHDMPKGEEMTADEFFLLLAGRNLPLALNIKADGLANQLKALLDKYNIQNYFVFDMSVPDTLAYLRMRIPVFARVSELEPEPVCYEQVTGIWLDAFYDIWYSPQMIQKFLQAGKKVCLVSPELHQRDQYTLWNSLKDSNLDKESALMLCTDFPEDAQQFFH